MLFRSVMGKILNDDQKQALLWDVERGIPDRPQARHWQTCTCIGDWHYNQSTYNNNRYKSAAHVIRMLVDIVSKNGNLLLSVPVRANGTIDEKEEAIVKGIGAWMRVNQQSIYSTRPWKTFGEGPLAEAVNPMTGLVDPVNLFDRFAALCIEFWPIIIVVAFLSDPVAGGLAKLIVKPEQRYAEKVESSSAV